MKKNLLLFIVGATFALLTGCDKDDEIKVSPDVPFTYVLNQTEYQNGDSLYGKVIINTKEMVAGTKIEKIDCRLGNIVIGTTENEMECPFGIRLADKPTGTHILSIIIKCQSPDCDLTYWRHDIKNINIKSE